MPGARARMMMMKHILSQMLFVLIWLIFLLIRRQVGEWSAVLESVWRHARFGWKTTPGMRGCHSAKQTTVFGHTHKKKKIYISTEGHII